VWICARSEPHREQFATGELRRRGYEIYLPRIAEHIVRRGRKITVEKPLFASNIFVVVIDRWYDCRWCPGIAAVLLGADGIPAQVPPKVITDLKGRERNGLIVLPQPPCFRPGDRVRVTRGVLAGLSGLYQGQRSRERVAVLRAVLGRVELAAGDVAAM
jgi:transcriptional antiterminator RfaH